MKHNSKPFLRSRKFVLLVSASSALACAAHAQAPATNPPAATPPPASPPPAGQVTEIVVTGTQIRGVAPVGSEVISVGQKDIQDTGLLTTTDVIRSLPQFSNLGANALVTNSATNNATLNVTRANGINLRGLGPQATLVLVDGHRPAPEGVAAQLFDPAAIPTLAVSRIEVVADGASATYGADAVAGVVNVILRKNFDGLEALASGTTANGYNGSEEGVIFGKKWEGGSLMISGDHQQNSTLQASSRAKLYNADQTAYGGYDQNVFASVPGNLCPTASCSLTASPSKIVYGLPATNGVGLTAAQLSATPNQLSAFNNISLLPQIDRNSFVGAISQEVTPDLTLRAEAFDSLRHYKEDVGDLTKSVTVPSTNPFYVTIPGTAPCAASLGAPAGATCESVAYDFSKDLGATIRTGYELNYQVDAGADYKLPHDFKLSADYVYSKNVEDDWAQGLNANAVTTAILNTNPATSLNVFGSGSSNNAATLASIEGYSYRYYVYTSKFGSLHLDGPLYKLPGGDIRVAIGGEIHSDQLTGVQIGNTTTTTTSQISVTSGPSTDQRTVRSAYGEFLVPIFGSGNAMTGLQKLELDVAIRYDDYSDFGGTTNPKYSLKYNPIDELTINANYGTSFRAPTLSDKDPSSTATAFYNNPSFASCGCNSIDIVGGNSNIKPETAKTYSIGGDYKPHWLTGLTTTLTYFHVDYKNIIDNPGSLNPLVLTNPAYSFLLRKVNPATNAADLAYVQSILNTTYYYSPTALPATAYNLVIDGQRVNVGESLTSGLDFALNYRWGWNGNDFNVGVSGEYLTQYDYEVVPGAPFVNDLNKINFPLKFKGRATAGFARGGFRANVYLNYVNSYTDNIAAFGSATTPLGTMNVAPYVTTDGSIAYSTGDRGDLGKNITVSLNIQNMLDVKPPLALTGTYIYDSTVASPVGRQLTLQVRKAF